MNKHDVIKLILAERWLAAPKNKTATAYAPSNIALCKYWGKRNHELNLPVTSSLSISLADKGATITIVCAEQDSVTLNQQALALDHTFSQRLFKFINLFRPNKCYFKIDITSNIPIAAGLASSACGFASIVKALNELFAWQLHDRELSILARLGSGSACRSLWQGFVLWEKGVLENGMDSYAFPLAYTWPELNIGLVLLTQKEKSMSSREAMKTTVETSPLYTAWPDKVAKDMVAIQQAVQEKNFHEFGKIAESNALAMHATMLSAWPPISYALPETITAMQRVWQLRADGLPVYFTQDAGPNLKLLFLNHFAAEVRREFPDLV